MPLSVSNRPESARLRKLSLPDLVRKDVDLALLHSHILMGSKWEEGTARPILRNLNEKDQQGLTALDVATAKANVAAIKLLASYGAKLGSEIP